MGGNSLRIGLAGLGTVGQGLLQLLRENSERITRQAGMPVEVVRVASRTPKPDVDLGSASFDTDLATLQSDDVDVVVELIGGVDHAHALVETSLANGKAVVTANKAMLAEHGNTVLESACAFGFEAAVAGGIPIIGALKAGVAGNRVDWLAGIINGTCNYIITAMDEHGTSFADALADAQRLGYAEADPSFDVDGVDAAQKLAILAAVGFDVPIDMDGLYIEGISGIEVEDLQYARELGFRIKHLGIARRTAAGIETRVHPALVPEQELLGQVSDVANAVSVGANAVGSLLLVGPGAGALPTASSVLADLIEVARGTCAAARVGLSDLPRVPITDTKSSFYLNVPAVDQPGVFAEIADILSRDGISIEAVIQKPEAIRHSNDEAWVPIVILTNVVQEAAMDKAQAALSEMASVHGDIRRIRVADLQA